jgi:succinate-semialdehyde dehydrogenase/glutarate-semialdehyde dehydrogenase
VLELGGSDPFLVMESADLDLAVEAAVLARCINSGQSCIAAKRFLVQDSIYEAFESRFVAGMAAMRVGDPELEETQIGPLATPAQVDDLEAQIAAAVQAGARILTGGERLPGPGNYFQPTVLSGVPRASAVYREEIFGPVAMLFGVRDLDHAIDLANDTPFGLGASAWTRNLTEQRRLAAELQCGAVFLNAPVASDPRLPFGGIKRSGYGRELSAAGMREFLNAKTVFIAEPISQGRPARTPAKSAHRDVTPISEAAEPELAQPNSTN